MVSSSAGMNPFLEAECGTVPATGDEEAPAVPIDAIARQLLRQSFFLTALELHLELSELGAELPRLRAFFSNPGNFERQTPFRPEPAGPLPRSSSQATLDSIELGRLSEDGQQLADERTALLEFQLRKAHDTIRSLRANLTGAAELNSPDQGGGDRPAAEHDPIRPHERRALNFLVNEYLLRHGYKLAAIAFSDENEDQDVEDWDDVGLNVPRPPELLHFFREGGRPPEPPPPPPGTDRQCQTEQEEEPTRLQAQLVQLVERVAELESQLRQAREAAEVRPAEDRPEPEPTSSEPPQSRPSSTPPPAAPPSDVPERFVEAVLAACVPEQAEEAVDEAIGRLRREVARPSDTPEQAVLQLARCLPHIVPNVILARREELIPLLLSAIQLHPDIRQRDVLLNLLFNLIKRPDGQQRAVILAGFRSLVSRLCPGRLEEEVLPQCWEQISHKYLERRLLVAEACAVLSPFIPPELRGSLVWSMLHQLATDEREPAVRAAAARGLAVVLLHCQDGDKLNQVWELTGRLLEERCEPVRQAAAELLLPVVAGWAGRLGLLTDRLVPHALTAARQAAQRADDWTLAVWLQTLSALLDHVFLWLVSAGPHLNRTAEHANTTPEITEGRLPPSESGPLSELEVLYGDGPRLRRLIAAYDDYVTQEWYQLWPPLKWIIEHCVPELVSLAEAVPLSCPEAVQETAALLRRLAHLLGPTVTDSKLWPCCEGRLQSAVGLSSALLPAVCAGLLAAPSAAAERRLAALLEEALCQPAAEPPLAASCRLLLLACRPQPPLQLLWTGVVHAAAEVRAAAGRLAALLAAGLPPELLAGRLLPALVTLASDQQLEVRRAAVPALGLVLEARPGRPTAEKTRLQLAALCQEPALGPPLAAALGRAAAAAPDHTEFCAARLAELAARAPPGEAAQLLDAFTALSCGPVPPATVTRDVLPALRVLLEALAGQGPPQADRAAALIRDFEQRVAAPPAGPETAVSPTQPAGPPGMDEVRSRVNKMLSSAALQSRSSQLGGLFRKK